MAGNAEVIFSVAEEIIFFGVAEVIYFFCVDLIIRSLYFAQLQFMVHKHSVILCPRNIDFYGFSTSGFDATIG